MRHCRWAVCVVILACAAAGAGSLQAASYTWDGGGGNANWSTPGNWTDITGDSVDDAPVSAADTSILFTGTTNLNNLNQNIANPLVLNRLATSTTAMGVEVRLTGSPLQFVADGATQPTLAHSRTQNLTVGNGVIIPASTTLTVTNSTWQLYFGGAISGAGTLQFNTVGGGEINLQNAANAFSGGLTYVNSGGAAAQWGRLRVSANALGAGTVRLGGGNVTAYNSSSNAQPGGLVLDGTATYANSFVLTDTSPIFASDASGSGSNITLSGPIDAGGYTLVLRGGGAGGANGIISNGSLSKIDGGTWTLRGANTYAGPTSVSAGTLAVASTGKLYSGVASPGAVTVSGGTLVLDSWADGASLASPLGAANLVLNGGTLRVATTNAADNAGAGRAFTIGAAGGTLESTASQTWTLGKFDPGNGSDSYPIVSSGGLLTLSGSGTGVIGKAIPGAGGLAKTGTGLWVLAGANAYAGATAVNQGVLRVQHANALGSTAASTTVASGAALELNQAAGLTLAEPLSLAGEGISYGGALRNVAGNNVVSGPITVNGARIGRAGGSLTLTGGVSGNNLRIEGGSVAVTTSPLSLSGTLYIGSGQTTVGVGGNAWSTLQIDYGGSFKPTAANVVPASSTVTLGDPWGGNTIGTFDLGGFNATVARLQSGSPNSQAANSVLTNTGAAATLTVNEAGSASYGGKLQGNLTLRKQGAGTLVLGSTVAYSSSVSLAVAGGTLDVRGSGYRGNVASIDFIAGSVTDGDGTVDAQFNVQANAPDAFRIRGGCTWPLGLALSGAYANGITFDAAANGTATISGPDLYLEGASKIITVQDGSADQDLVVSAVIRPYPAASAWGLTKAGPGTLVATGNNIFTGPMVLSGGRLSVPALADGGTASPLGQSSNAAANLVFDGGTLQYTGPTASTNRRFTINPGKTATFDVADPAATLSFSDITGSVLSGSIVKTGQGTLSLARAASGYLGSVDTISVLGGTLTTPAGNWVQINVSNATGNAITLANGATLNLPVPLDNQVSGGTQRVKVLASPATATISAGITLAGSGASGSTHKRFDVEDGLADIDLLLSGGLTYYNGTANVIKSGAGTMSMTAASEYTGTTTVEAGTLLVNNSAGSATGSGAVFVAGGRLGGSGIVGGAVTLQSGAVAPGQSAGTLTVNGDYVQQPAGTLQVEIGGYEQGQTYDWLKVLDEATLAGTLEIDWLGVFIGHGPFTVLTAANGITNVDLSALRIDAAGASYGQHAWVAEIVSLGGSAEALQISLVPEPASMTLLLLGLPAAAGRIRRRLRS